MHVCRSVTSVKRNNQLFRATGDVTLDMEHIAKIDEFYETDPFSRPVIDKLASSSVGRGMTIMLDAFGKMFKLPPSECDLVNNDWVPFAVASIRKCHTVGFFAMNAARDPQSKRMVPYIIPWNMIYIMFTHSIKASRAYVVYDASTNRPLDCHLFIRHGPSDSGQLTAPLAFNYQMIKLGSRLLRYNERADFQRTTPTWALESVRSKATPDPLDTDEYTEGEVADMYNAAHQRIIAQEKRDFDGALRDFTASHERAMSKMNVDSATGKSAAAYNPTPADVAAPPWITRFMLPFNQHVSTTPQPQMNTLFDKVFEIITNALYNSLGVPPVLMASATVKTSQQSDRAIEAYDNAIKCSQTDLIRIVETAFYIVRNDQFMQYLEDTRSLVRKESERVLRVGTRGGDKALREQLQQAIDDRDQNSRDDVETLPATQEALIQAGRLLDMDDAELAGMIRSVVRIVIAFDTTPMINMLTLQQMHSEFLISTDKYAKMAGKIAGLAEDDILLGDDRTEERKRRTKEMEDSLPKDEMMKQSVLGVKAPTEPKKSPPAAAAKSKPKKPKPKDPEKKKKKKDKPKKRKDDDSDNADKKKQKAKKKANEGDE